MASISDLEITAQMDLSIIMPLPILSKNHRNWIEKADFFRKGNFIELIIIISAKNSVRVRECIARALPANISLITVDSGSIADWYYTGIRSSSFDNVLLMTPSYIESNDSLIDLLRLKKHYSNSYIYSVGAANIPKKNVQQCILASKVDILQTNFRHYALSNVYQLFDVIRILLGQTERIEIKTNEECSKSFPKTFIRLSPEYIEIHKKIQETHKLVDWTIDVTTGIKRISNKFKKLEVFTPQPQKNKHNIICLLQVKNEAHIIEEALNYFSAQFDGIILLDDGSTDGTFELAVSPKLLCKAQKKKISKNFNDLENRNLLLELAFFFKSNWLIFVDADERLHHKYDDIKRISQTTEANVLEFKCVHLWDSADKYRVDIPEGSNGLMSRCRMFRHRGWMQIYSNREIYFTAVPFLKNTRSAPILILHYGLLDKAVRKRKYDLYKAQDIDGKKQGYAYEYLLDDEPKLAEIESVQLSTNSTA